MSKVTAIKTKIKIEPMDVCKRLAAKGNRIAIKDEKPTAKLYIPGISIREIEISQEDYGYQVRITVLACKEDFELYRDIIKTILEMTNGKAIYENEIMITEPFDYFTDEYIKESMDNELSAIMLVLKDGSEIDIICPFRNFSIGENIYSRLAAFKDDLEAARVYLYDLVRKSQYDNIGLKDTPIFSVQLGSNSDGEYQNLSFYKKNDHDYISVAKLFALSDETEQLVIIEFSDLPKIVPKSWTLIDEKQYKTHSLTDAEWEIFVEKAKELQLN